jgi:hypothetical protein
MTLCVRFITYYVAGEKWQIGKNLNVLVRCGWNVYLSWQFMAPVNWIWIYLSKGRGWFLKKGKLLFSFIDMEILLMRKIMFASGSRCRDGRMTLTLLSSSYPCAVCSHTRTFEHMMFTEQRGAGDTTVKWDACGRSRAFVCCQLKH